MFSTAIQSGVNIPITCSSSFSSRRLSQSSCKSSIVINCKPNKSLLPDISILGHRSKYTSRNLRVKALASPEALTAETSSENEDSSTTSMQESSSTQEPKMKEVVVKPMNNPRLVLKFIWMEKNIGLGVDQIIPGHGSLPLSPYYFWPRKDAWEELKAFLESKPWISQKKMIILLNQATDIINLWQQSGGNLS